MPSVQDHIIDYYHFLIKREFNYPLFNGHMAHVKVMVGEGAYLATPEKFAHLLLDRALSTDFFPEDRRHTVE